MIKASDDDIREFFATTIFEGIFSKEIKSNHAEYFKGHIHSIKIAGEPTNVIGNYINVPVSANEIPEGECTFKCRVKEEVRQSPSQINFSLSPKTLRSKSTLKPMLSAEPREGEISNEDLFELWGVDDCECIGYYHFDPKSGGYLIDDLRKTNFDCIPPYLTNKKPITLWLKYPQKGIEVDNYYRFTWKLSHKDPQNPYEIYLDSRFSPQTITPKWFIDKLFEDRHSDKSKNFGSAANFLDTLSKQLSARESTFVYELLQNANDYPVEGQMVDVEFHITDNYLLFLHSGDKFNVRNISGICGINEKEKIANRKTIGYKGIGFKTVFLNNHYVYLRTGDYSFRFDQGETPEKKRGGKIKRQDAPFQILPIWTEHNEVSPEVNSVFDNADPKFQVQIALRPDSQRILHLGRNSYENLFREVFSDSNIILFIPNINSVSVFINGKKERACFRNNEEWIVGDYENGIGEDLQLLINKTIEKGNSRIPEKYKDFDYTKVSFACNHEGAMIKPVNDATLYCYLPTKASWGLPFLMNTDMIPKGDRNDIETEVKLIDEDETNFNEELASIAGSKLFRWIHDLLTSRKYQLGSVFSLVPDFKKCKREHKDYTDFISKFENAFNDCIETETIVPVPQGISLVKNVLLDTTGLSTSGIMSDEEFCKFTGMESYYLPLPMLRKDKNFLSFLKRYAQDDQKFEEKNLVNLIANKDFKEWLGNQENNNKFLNFLLEKGFLENLMEEEIFLENEGGLLCASNLFYDIDNYLEDLHAFECYILFLSPQTREYFKDNEKWNEITKGAFAEFNCDEFVDDTLMSSHFAETKEKLKDKSTSIHFFKFLAENVTYSEEYNALPFISVDDELVDDFEDKYIFFKSEVGKKIFEAKWLSSIDVAFVSDEYTDKTRKYFKENFGVVDFTHDYLVRQIILSEETRDYISEGIDDDYEVSKDFVDYCYRHKSLFESGSLRNYALSVYDGDGDNDFCLSEDVIYFASDKYDEYAGKDWVNYNWMYALNEDYYDGIADKKDFIDFLDKTFWVARLTEKNFYQKVVKPHLSKIFQLISGDNDPDGSRNFDFVSYLDRNFKLIFEDEHDGEAYKSMTLCSNDDTDVKVGKNIYLYDDELVDLLSQSWFPEGAAYCCHKNYGNSKALETIGCSVFKFGDFYDNIIIPKLSVINRLVKSKETSIAFHSYIIDRKGILTESQLTEMREAKVYLYGHTAASSTSTGHKTLSAKARELFDHKLVSISELDIIDPDYKTSDNAEYWETRLGNGKFNVTDFFTWLKNNVATFNKTIATFELNKVFYRWLKENASDAHLEGIHQLSLTKFVMHSEGTRKSDTIYFPNAYMPNGGTEDIVKIFDPNAWFISPDYIEEGDDIESWQSFWVKLGVKSDIVDILYGTVIKSLVTIDNEDLPKLIADNRPALEELYDNELVSHLKNLRVKGRDGNFYTLNETIYIDCDLDEPFAYIELPNVVAFDTKEEKKLIKDIIEEVKGTRITTLSEWQQSKVDYYLKLQKDNVETVRNIHYQFIEELTVIRQTSRDRLKAIEHIREILLLNKDNEFVLAKELTLGSVYHPNFDFEYCTVQTPYVSDKYQEECKENVGRLFSDMGIHLDFEEKDVSLLTHRKCAIYFWTQYLPSQRASIDFIKEIIAKHQFDNLECIPTKDYMKRPTQLYYGKEVKNYVKSIEDWENKVPLQDIPEISISEETTLFSLLPFGTKLKFADALFALYKKQGQDTRSQLLYWIIADYKEELHQSIIEQYREDEEAKWYNNNNEPTQIKQLYALDYFDKSLKQYLGSSPKIVNEAYFPAGNSFKLACDILGIPTITSEDLIIECSDDSIITTQHNDFKVYALVIAGIIDSASWKPLYDMYCEKIDALVLHRCSNINITCKQDRAISKSLKKFYHVKGSEHFYYVDNKSGWHDGRIYKDFYKSFAEYIGALNITDDHLNDLMYSREDALRFVEENNTLKLDDVYKEKLEKLMSGSTNSMVGNVAVEDNDEETEIYRPKINIVSEDVSTEEEYPADNSSDREDVISHDIEKEDELYNESGNDLDAVDEEPNEETEGEESDGEYDEEEPFEEDVPDEEDELSDEKVYSLDSELEAVNQDVHTPHRDEFLRATIQRYLDGEHEEVVCEHYRNGTWVRGHYRNGIWISGHWRSGSFVTEHSRTAPDREFVHTPSPKESFAHNTGHSEDKGETVQNSYKRPSERKDTNQKETPSPKEKSTTPPLGNSYDPDRGMNVGSVENDRDYQPLGAKPYPPRQRRNIKPYTREEMDRLRSNPSPLQLESLPPTAEEIDILAKCGISVEQIADTNYLANLRLYQNLQKEHGEEPEEGLEQFIRNDDDVATHRMKSGKYIRAYSAARGVMYVGPSVWKKMVDDKWSICVYLDGQGKKFAYINSAEEFLELVAKDDVVIKITGKEKIDVVNMLYNGILNGVKGSAYTLIRVAAQTNMDAVFAHYVGAMAEKDDGNEELNSEEY